MKATTYNIITLFSLLTLFLVSTSCTDELATATGRTTENQTPRFVVSTNSPQTRVSYGSITQSTFEEGDVLGAFVLDKDDNIVINSSANITYSNIQYQVVGNASDGTKNLEPVLSQDALPYGDGTYRYIFYYPFREGTTYNNVTHTVQTNQTTSRLYELSDLLWDVATVTPGTDNAPTVEVAMDHAMANIVLNVDRSYLSSGNDGYKVYILKTPYMADDINLSQALDNENRSYTVDNEHTTDIRMWCSNNEAQTETLQFRAVIPACQTISSGSPFLRITAADGTQKQFSLKENLTLLSGRNYIFTVTENEEPTPIIPDVTDDDSWVFDVLDPETNEPVGLLCREYLRYQPETLPYSGEYASGDLTNIPIEPANQCWVNSQAWVFYQLKDKANKIPDLNTGTVLRFLYDVEYNGWAYYPQPHESYQQQGIFTPEHGYRWGQGTLNTEGYGEQLPNSFIEHYMNGGTVNWDGENNKIKSFIKPTQQITCEQAKNGFIAITGNGNDIQAKVSYDTELNSNIRKGVLYPHYLIDTRPIKDADGTINKTNYYPLVKIGYNQFWMSKPLHVTSLTDGTPLPCYNKKGNENTPKPAQLDIEDNALLNMGYIYPFDNDITNGNGTTTIYDPYNDETEMNVSNYPEIVYRPSPLYNKAAVEDDRFVPQSEHANRYYYTMPIGSDVEKMITYFGEYFAAKMSTKDISNKSYTNCPPNNEHFKYYKYEAAIKGQTHSYGGTYINCYTANISGFNLRAIGYFCSWSDNIGTYQNLTGSAAFIIKTNEPYSEYFEIPIYSPFNKTSTINDIYKKITYWDEKRSSRFFAQVRLLMKYRNQADTGGSTSSNISSITRSASSDDTEEKSINHNIYIPIQPAD